MKSTIGQDALHRNDPKWNSCPPGEFTVSENFLAPQRVGSLHNGDARAAVVGGFRARGCNRRRSTCRAFEALIRVYGKKLDGSPFYEDAKTINVSVHGALMILNVPVSMGQKLLLFNEATQRQQVCQITDIRIRDTESFEVAVAFPTPHAEFWHVPPASDKMRFPSKTKTN